MVANSPTICTILSRVRGSGARLRLGNGLERGPDHLADREHLNAMLGPLRALDLCDRDACLAGAIE